MTAKERVELELSDLKIKNSKLANTLDANGFGNLAIPIKQLLLLKQQFYAMMLYEHILEVRLAMWDIE